MTPPAQPQLHGLRAPLNAVRKELLDLGLRNPLLNYRPLKSRGLEVVGERSSDIYRILVAEGKHFSLLPSDEQGSAEGSIFSSIDDETAEEEIGLGVPWPLRPIVNSPGAEPANVSVAEAEVCPWYVTVTWVLAPVTS